MEPLNYSSLNGQRVENEKCDFRFAYKIHGFRT